MEIFGISITFFSLVITFFSFVIAYQSRENGRWMKLAIAKIDEHIKDMDIRHTQLLEKMDNRLEKMDEHLIKIDQQLSKMDEHLIKIDQQLSKMDEHLKGISELITEEAKANRELLDRIDKRIPERTAYLIKEK